MSSRSCLQELMDQATTFAEAGEYASAIPVFQAITESNHTDSYKAWEMMAQCFLEMEAWDKALDAANHAVTLCPTWAEAWLTLAHCQFNCYDLQKCQTSLQKVLELDRGHEMALKEIEEVKQLLSSLVHQSQEQIILLPSSEEDNECSRNSSNSTRCAITISEWRSESGNCSHASCSVCNQPNPISGCRDEGGPGMVLWQSGVLLAQYTSLLAKKFQHSHVLELGAGTGVVAIALGSVGANVVATDLPPVVFLLQHNIALNQKILDQAGGKVMAHKLNWKEVTNTHLLELLGSLPSLDYVVASDVIYNVATIPSFVYTLTLVRAHETLRASPSIAKKNIKLLLMHKRRNPVVEEKLLQALASEGIFVCETDENAATAEAGKLQTVQSHDCDKVPNGSSAIESLPRDVRQLLAGAREQKCVLYAGNIC